MGPFENSLPPIRNISEWIIIIIPVKLPFEGSPGNPIAQYFPYSRNHGSKRDFTPFVVTSGMGVYPLISWLHPRDSL
jgi:hypothetical protein